MPLWGKTDQAVTANSTTTKESTTGAPIGTNHLVKLGGGANAHFGNTSSGSRAAGDSAMYANNTPGAFIPGATFGVWAVNDAEAAANRGKGVSHAGWNLRKAGTGPVASVTASGGSGFANGETGVFSNGTTNGTFSVVSNATANLASAVVTGPGAGWAKAADVAVTFNREQHLGTITVAGTPTGYSNTDKIVVSNGTINAAATISTNSTGGFVTANVTITNVGLFSNVAANTSLVFTVKAANGAASAGSGATLTGNLATSTGGALVVTMGGRAGRVHYETLVAISSMAANNTALP